MAKTSSNSWVVGGIIIVIVLAGVHWYTSNQRRQECINSIMGANIANSGSGPYEAGIAQCDKAYGFFGNGNF